MIFLKNKIICKMETLWIVVTLSVLAAVIFSAGYVVAIICLTATEGCYDRNVNVNNYHPIEVKV